MSDTSGPVVLPEHLEEHTVAGMLPGDSAWVTPWTMVVDDERRCWIRGEYTPHNQPGGTVSMRITRAESGFIVHAPAGQLWARSSDTPQNPIPVIQVCS